MGIFYKHVPVFNRAPVSLSVRFDGQDIELPPGPATLPEIVIPFALNQHPIMGSQDPNNPHVSGARYLIGVMGQEAIAWQAASNCEPLTRQEWEDHLCRPCRIDEEAVFAEKYANDPKARMVILGKGRKSTASSVQEAGKAPRGEASFEARD